MGPNVIKDGLGGLLLVHDCLGSGNWPQLLLLGLLSRITWCRRLDVRGWQCDGLFVGVGAARWSCRIIKICDRLRAGSLPHEGLYGFYSDALLPLILVRLGSDQGSWLGLVGCLDGR